MPISKEISDEERKIYKETFDKFDKDKNGYIDSSELESVLRALGQKASKEEIDKFIADVDKDKNGKLDFDEFSKHLAAKRRADFNEMDPNGDGYVTAKELAELYKKYGCAISEEDAQKIIAKDDLNKDGKLSYIEFVIDMKGRPLQ